MGEQWLPHQHPADGPTYLAIVKALERDIQSGRLQPGDRLPPQRELAKTMGISLGTVSRAYTEASKKELIYGGGRSGTFVGQRGAAPADFQTSSPAGAGAPIDLARNYPAIIDDPDLSSLLKGISESTYSQFLLRYTGAGGYLRHRKAGTAWLRALGLDVHESQILPTSGAQEALAATLVTIARPGDIIAVDQLTYPGMHSLCSVLGLKLLGVPSDDDGIIPDELGRLARAHTIKALYVVPTLSNPTGSTIPIERRRAIAQLAEREDFFIIDDDIYRALLPAPPPTFAELTPARCFLVASVSKTVCGGLRVGFTLPPANYLEALKKTQLSLIYNVSPIPMEVFARLVDDGLLFPLIKTRREDAARRQSIALEYLADFGLAAGIPSYSVWLTLPDHWNAKSFAISAQQLGILLCDSGCFALDDPPPVEAVRICLSAAESLDILRTALKTLARLLEQTPHRGEFTV